jgi:hypothetical protein
MNPFASMRTINVSKQFILEQYERVNQPDIFRHGIMYKNNSQTVQIWCNNVTLKI